MAKNISGTYKFDTNFYAPNYELVIQSNDGYLTCQWGDLIPIDNGEKNSFNFILRTYWSSIYFAVDTNGQINKMEFDGHIGMKMN